jgi:pimeloyl-ACP methyl ester carboxylesterase
VLRLRGAGHLLMREAADVVNRAIEEFLIGVTP